MNSSLAPFGPRVRNSLITTGGTKPEGDGVGEVMRLDLAKPMVLDLDLVKVCGVGVGFGSA